MKRLFDKIRNISELDYELSTSDIETGDKAQVFAALIWAQASTTQPRKMDRYVFTLSSFEAYKELKQAFMDENFEHNVCICNAYISEIYVQVVLTKQVRELELNLVEFRECYDKPDIFPW